ncbi:class II aldolase/adducin family protein [Salipiger sp. P9]|uniref:class II aldolase/adducin family protein n=1 Tax=Salipiger pentaromativorans TaxID=2943193 RepID=UPI002157EF3E|nr:class II aldolase/adducin family protein [Salipiger pentaromativorans]MCR8549230.1 class II aldolase/adducin family protein [Salipiger pentaromativorans]
MSHDALISELALANRLLVNEDVLDTFGHVSCRHPDRPDRYFLAAALAPVTVGPADILEFDLDGALLTPSDRPLYSERVIHSEIYRARPDVAAIVHHHAPAVLPFCVSGQRLVPVTQTGAAMGPNVPFWDSADDFGDTNLLLTRPEEGQSLARALGPDWVVLMKRHGATVVGRSLREMVFRAIHSTSNARTQMQAMLMGGVDALTPGEIALAGGDLKPSPVNRTWNHALRRLHLLESGITG